MNGWPSHELGGPAAQRARNKRVLKRRSKPGKQTRTAVRRHQLGPQLLHDAEAQVVLAGRRQAVAAGRLELGGCQQSVQCHHLRRLQGFRVAARGHAVAALGQQPVRQRAVNAGEFCGRTGAASVVA